jgi:hypothetical protein
VPELTADIAFMLRWIAGALILIFVLFRFTLFLGAVAIWFYGQIRGGR